MANTKLPNPLELRHLLVKDLDEAVARKWADVYLEEGRLAEAVQFFAKAGAGDALAQLRDRAVEAGDAFLLRRISELAGQDVSADEWRRLGDAAQAQGKERYAVLAARQADVADA